MYVSIDDAIKRLESYTPITEEDKATFETAINALKFAKDFVGMSPEKMEHAMKLMDALEYVICKSIDKEVYKNSIRL